VMGFLFFFFSGPGRPRLVGIECGLIFNSPRRDFGRINW